MKEPFLVNKLTGQQIPFSQADSYTLQAVVSMTIPRCEGEKIEGAAEDDDISRRYAAILLKERGM